MSSTVAAYPNCLGYDPAYPTELAASLPQDSEVYEIIELYYSSNPTAVEVSILYPLKNATKRRVYRKSPVTYLIPAKYWKIIASRLIPRYCQYKKYTRWEIEKTRRHNSRSKRRALDSHHLCLDMGEAEAMQWTYYKRLWDGFLNELSFWNQRTHQIEDWNDLESNILHCWVHREFYGCEHDQRGREMYIDLVKDHQELPYSGDLCRLCTSMSVCMNITDSRSSAWNDTLQYSICLPPPSALEEDKTHVILSEQRQKRYAVWLKGKAPEGWKDNSWIEEKVDVDSGSDAESNDTDTNSDTTEDSGES
jgi:hypothetical protein